MAEANQLDSLRKRHSDEVEAVSRLLESNKDFRPLDPSEMKFGGQNCTLAWRTTVVTTQKTWVVEVGLGKHFPDEPPLVRVCDWESLYLKSPHVMDGGLLCTLPASDAIDSTNSVGLFWFILGQTQSILEGTSADDFREEFTAYWGRRLTKGAKDALLLDSVENLDRSFPVCFCKGYVCIALTAEKLNHWVLNWVGKKKDLNPNKTGIKISLDRPLTPEEYPDTLADLLSLANEHDSESAPLILEHVFSSHNDAFVLLVQREGDGDALAGIVLHGLNLIRSKAKEITHGFRQGHVPPAILLARSQGRIKASKLSRCKVVRVDHNWIHSRGGDGRDLSSKKVLLIGCGSLGGYVGHLLARAGVGFMTVTDNDTLGWENLGRHVLGAGAVGSSKAKALANELSSQLPHLEVTGIPLDWRDALAKDADLFNRHDIIVSTVADWRCERPLNELARTISMPPIILGWLEPHAVAGHSLVISNNDGGCYECSANSFGQFMHRIADFEGETMSREPGGCTHYQRYGPSALMPVASMISSVVIDTLLEPPTCSYLSTWVSSQDHLQSVRATISEQWDERIKVDGHSRTYRNDWPASERCRLCSMQGGDNASKL